MSEFVNEMKGEELTEVLHAVVDEHVGLGMRNVLELKDFNTIKKNLDTTESNQQKGQSSQLSDEAKKVLRDIVLQRKPELLQNQLQLSSEFSSLTMNDFDWSMRLVMSSDKMSQLRVPVLMLKISLKNNETGKDEDVVIELNKNEFERLFTQLEKINSVIDGIRSR